MRYGWGWEEMKEKFDGGEIVGEETDLRFLFQEKNDLKGSDGTTKAEHWYF